MPVYQVVTSGIDLSQEQRDTLAKRLTETHHRVTQAPEPFIRIVFQPMPLGLIYSTGEIAPALILAGCRAGRSDATRTQLLQELYHDLREVTDVPAEQIVVAISETPSPWLIEAGMVMPQATHDDEAAWIERLRQEYPGKYDSYAVA